MEKEFFAKGKRAIVYKGVWKKKVIAIKVERKDIAAKGRIKNEIKWLKKLNKYDIGPKILKTGKDYFVYEFIMGERILDWMAKNKKERIKKILTKILNKCRTLDKLRVNKEEMHKPYKHILIKGEAVKMIDFERCHETGKPKNVTQFCQFLTSAKVSQVLKQKNFKIKKEELIKTLKFYKKSGYAEKVYKKILEKVLA